MKSDLKESIKISKSISTCKIDLSKIKDKCKPRVEDRDSAFYTTCQDFAPKIKQEVPKEEKAGFLAVEEVKLNKMDENRIKSKELRGYKSFFSIL
jgi:hypothetical protein